MKKILIILIITLISTMTSFAQNESSVITDSAVLVRNEEVKLYATITNVCNCSGTVNVGFRLITMTGPDVPYVVNVDCPVHYLTGMTTYIFDTIGLQEQTSYSYMAYIEDSMGIYYGELKTFITGSNSLSAVNNNNTIILLYPNPVKEEAILSFSSLLLTTQIFVINMQGSIINSFEIQPQTKTFSINTYNLKSGIYYLLIQNRQFSTIKKLIKK